MTVEELMDNSREDLGYFILNCSGAVLEKVSELPKMLEGIGYLDQKDELLNRITSSEILDAEECNIKGSVLNQDCVEISCSIGYILQTFIDSDFLWRVTGVVNMIVSIPNSLFAEVEEFDCDDYEKYLDKVSFHHVQYTNVECDTIS